MDAGRRWQDVFIDHPVRLGDPPDPLVSLKEFRATLGRTQEIATGSPRAHIGFACLWDKIPELTWSTSAWNLRAALRRATDTTDIGVEIPRLTRDILRAVHARRRAGRLTTTWYYSRLTESYVEHALRRGLSQKPGARRCDAVLTIHDLAALPVPYFTYSDITWDGFAEMTGGAEAGALLLSMSSSAFARRSERQRAIYERATGVIVESRWLARGLAQQTGISPEKIYVVPPGISSGRPPSGDAVAAGAAGGQRGRQAPPLPRERATPRRRLLFVGRDFYRKGGDLAVGALAHLRREYDPRITLTIAGPQTWPMPGSPPDGVKFLGTLPADEVASLYDSHDLFVMPSRCEPFGLVFAEALGRGLPCVARDAFAMPEIITPGVSGALVTGNDESKLAAAIAAVLADDTLYESCYQRAPDMTEYFSWERTGLQVSDVITRALEFAP